MTTCHARTYWVWCWTKLREFSILMFNICSCQGHQVSKFALVFFFLSLCMFSLHNQATLTWILFLSKIWQLLLAQLLATVCLVQINFFFIVTARDPMELLQIHYLWRLKKDLKTFICGLGIFSIFAILSFLGINLSFVPWHHVTCPMCQFCFLRRLWLFLDETFCNKSV